VLAAGPASPAGSRGLAAECGGAQQATPSGWHRHYQPPLAVGDSTMLLSMAALAGEGFSVDARGCRQYSEALSLLGALAQAHQLPHLVVLALGANGAISEDDVRQTIQILGPERVLVLVTQRQSGSDSQVLWAQARRFSAEIRILDWVSYSVGHPDWFQPDGLHLTLPGAAGFARLLARSLREAAPFKPPPPPLCPTGPAGVPRPLTGVVALVPRGVLALAQGSGHLTLTLSNSNAFPVLGVAKLGYRAGARIASACVAIPASSHARLRLTLTGPALADLQLRGSYAVRLLLALEGPEGARGTATGAYLLQ
jgi:hypothetical protein